MAILFCSDICVPIIRLRKDSTSIYRWSITFCPCHHKLVYTEVGFLASDRCRIEIKDVYFVGRMIF